MEIAATETETRERDTHTQRLRERQKDREVGREIDNRTNLLIPRLDLGTICEKVDNVSESGKSGVSGNRERRMREIQMQQPAATAGGDWHTGRQVRRHTDREASQDILTER